MTYSRLRKTRLSGAVFIPNFYLEISLEFPSIIPLEFDQGVWRHKTRVHCFRTDMFSRFDRTSTCDGQTDRQTRGQSIYLASIESRDKNCLLFGVP